MGLVHFAVAGARAAARWCIMSIATAISAVHRFDAYQRLRAICNELAESEDFRAQSWRRRPVRAKSCAILG